MDVYFDKNLLLPMKSFEQICRTCLVVDKLYNIKDVSDETTKLIDIISASVQFEDRPELPQNMCMNCIRKFFEVDRFLKQCVQTQLILQNILTQNTIKVEEVTLTHPGELEERTIEFCDAESGDLIETQEIPKEEKVNATYDVELDNEGETIILMQETQSEEESTSKLPEYFEMESFQDTILNFLKLDHTASETETVVKTAAKQKGPFFCETCSTEFDTYRDRDRHCQLVGHIPNKFSCKFCNKRFMSSHHLKSHTRVHTGEKPYCCNVCKKRFADRSTFVRHKLLHGGSRKYKCSSCDEGFIRKEFLEDHKRKHHEAEKLLCMYCGKEYVCYNDFRVHINKEHLKKEVKIDPSIPYQCTKCGKIYADEKVLQEHEDNHKKKEVDVDNKTFECKHCQEKFTKKYLYRLHLLDSECTKLTTLYPCPECDTVSISKAAAYSHQVLHKEEKKNITYVCAICGKAFDKKTYYLRHCKEHTKERRFMCSDCGLFFFTKKHLISHHRTHTGEKPFVCDICDKPFRGRGNLNKHKLIHNNVKPYKCETCGHEFRDFYSLKKHVKLRHPDRLSYLLENTQNVGP